jgi:hypothetical protein
LAQKPAAKIVGLAGERGGGLVSARNGLIVMLAGVLTGLALSAPPLAGAAPVDKASSSSAAGGQHDFDFEIGAWRAHLKRRLHPLHGSNEWTEYDGTSVVRKVWDGRANLGEFNVANATTHLQGLTLRLYNPESRQWSIYWANSRDGSLSSTPMVGAWSKGRGLFYDQEPFEGRMVFVRFIFYDVTPTSFRLEQAFSADGGTTWESNWISTFTRDVGNR